MVAQVASEQVWCSPGAATSRARFAYPCPFQRLKLRSAGRERQSAGRERQRATRRARADRPLEPQFSEHGHPLEPYPGDLLSGREDADGDEEIERRSLFANIGRGEVYRDALQGIRRIPLEMSPPLPLA